MAIFRIDIPGLKGNVSEENLAFLSEVKIKILQRLSDPFFGSTQLAQMLQLSPNQVKKRLEMLTDHSAARLIKHFRMEYAMVLIRETQMPLKEVTLNTGFLEQGNFSRCFRNHYGRSPSSFRTASVGHERSLAYQWEVPLKQEDLKFIGSLCQEDDWIGQLMSLTVEQIRFQDFNPGKLALMLSQSPSQLNRKIKRYFNVTTGQFIKTIRLQLAAELLVHDQTPIGTVGYLVGFFDHPHFCRVFKEAFGSSPKEYRNSTSPGSIPSLSAAILSLNKIDK